MRSWLQAVLAVLLVSSLFYLTSLAITFWGVNEVQARGLQAVSVFAQVILTFALYHVATRQADVSERLEAIEQRRSHAELRIEWMAALGGNSRICLLQVSNRGGHASAIDWARAKPVGPSSTDRRTMDLREVELGGRRADALPDAILDVRRLATIQAAHPEEFYQRRTNLQPGDSRTLLFDAERRPYKGGADWAIAEVTIKPILGEPSVFFVLPQTYETGTEDYTLRAFDVYSTLDEAKARHETITLQPTTGAQTP
jgi:hypothetical protein